MSVHSNIKIFEGEKYAIIFNRQDMTLKLLPLRVYRSCEIEDLDDIQDAVEALMLLDNLQADLGDAFPSQKEQTKSSIPKQDQRPVLDRLTLNVSNTCNMACKYCYATGGTYYTRGLLMDKDIALKAVNFATRKFSLIKHVNFFGGEPTLNQETIELVCEYFIYLRTRGILSYLPQFGLTTNGYAISSRMFQILQNYNFIVSISLDGPKEIHNRLRPGKNNSGTYDAILENVKEIINMGITPEFECTYTAEHYRSGIDLVSLMDFFYDSFHCQTLHCPMVVTEANSRWFIPLETAGELYADAIRYSVRNLERQIPKSISVTTRLLNSLADKSPICHYCPAGKSTLTINADGSIYPCFMLMSETRYCLGNIKGGEYGAAPSDAIDALIEDTDKGQNLACRDCWAQPLCYGCIAEDLSREGAVIHRSAIMGQSEKCDFKRKLIEVFLKSVADAHLK